MAVEALYYEYKQKASYFRSVLVHKYNVDPLSSVINLPRSRSTQDRELRNQALDGWDATFFPFKLLHEYLETTPSFGKWEDPDAAYEACMKTVDIMENWHVLSLRRIVRPLYPGQDEMVSSELASLVRSRTQLWGNPGIRLRYALAVEENQSVSENPEVLREAAEEYCRIHRPEIEQAFLRQARVAITHLAHSGADIPSLDKLRTHVCRLVAAEYRMPRQTQGKKTGRSKAEECAAKFCRLEELRAKERPQTGKMTRQHEIHLMHQAGFTNQETADHLGITKGAVGAALTRARNKAPASTA